jgi:hypothetical protein
MGMPGKERCHTEGRKNLERNLGTAVGRWRLGCQMTHIMWKCLGKKKSLEDKGI